jgi:hypothetical protein
MRTAARAAPVAQSSPGEDSPELECPHCLRRRGPVLVDIIDERGRPLAIAQGHYVFYSGKQYTVRVRPQPPDRFGEVDQVTILPGEVLRTTMPATPYPSAEYIGTVKAKLVRPAVAVTEIVIYLHHTRWEPCSLSVPVFVRPSFFNQLNWALGLLALPLLSMLVRSFWAGENDQHLAAVTKMVSDSHFWLRAVVILIIVLAGLRALSWLPLPRLGRDE